MYITCEKCSTRYVVKADSIGDAGRTVKCASCGHKWFQGPASEEEKARIANEVNGGEGGLGGGSRLGTSMPLSAEARRILAGNLPTLTEKKKGDWSVPVLVKVACLALFISAGVAAPLAFHHLVKERVPASMTLYEKIGLAGVGEGIKLYNIKLYPKSRSSLMLKGTLVNETENPLSIAGIKVSFYDEHYSSVGSDYIKDDGSNPLPSGEWRDFDVPLKGVSMATRYMVVDLDRGNSVELMLR